MFASIAFDCISFDASSRGSSSTVRLRLLRFFFYIFFLVERICFKFFPGTALSSFDIVLLARSIFSNYQLLNSMISFRDYALDFFLVVLLRFGLSSLPDSISSRSKPPFTR